MTQRFEIHPTHPQQRLIEQAGGVLAQGGLVVVPTDTTYTLACPLGDKRALERVRQIRRLSDKHLLTLLCADLASLATYARVDNADYRVLKRYTPGPFTFVLPASREVPRRLLHPKRKTIGLRVPDHAICQALLQSHGEPLLSTTLRLPDADLPLTEADDAYDALAGRVELIIDGGACGFEPTTVVDMVEGAAVLRQGAGEFGMPAP
ncbi:MAG: L-threonylcarbamoyladenylate synthase [Pseudomonadota bacterium]